MNDGGYANFSNNPFINDPNNPQNRYPDISVPQPQNPWLQSTDPNAFVYQTLTQPQVSPILGFNQGVPPQFVGNHFQPSSINGSGYGYLNGQTPVQNGYHPAQQQLRDNPSYIAQFDPYSSVGQGWDGSAQPAHTLNLASQNVSSLSALSPTTTTTAISSTSPTGQPHPREFLRTHKAEIEAWDGYAWKQLLNAFGALKDAWEVRARELVQLQMQIQMQYGGGGYYQAAQGQQEHARLQSLWKDAQSYSDSIAASLFQMQEVHQGYRQSSDPASKRRVREAPTQP